MYTGTPNRMGASAIESGIGVQIAVNLSVQAQLNYERNKEATKPFHRLYPLPAQHYPSKGLRNDIDIAEMSMVWYPAAFPKSVAKFVELSGNDVRSLLEFYQLTNLEDTIEVPPTSDFAGPFLFTSINGHKTAIGRHQCMEVLAKHIGLNFMTIDHPLLGSLRGQFPSVLTALDSTSSKYSGWNQSFRV